jgi:hypothetical protein
MVQTLRNIGGLLLNGNENVASFVIEPFGRVVVADVADGFTNDFLVIELGLGSNFAKDHDHASLGCGLTSNF